MENYHEKLLEEDAALKQQQKVANNVAENKVLEDAGLEADDDDNYDIQEVTDAVAIELEKAKGTTDTDGVIGKSGGTLGNNAPVNDETIAIALNQLNKDIADAQKEVNELKGPKMTAVNVLQNKLDAYQKAADSVKGAVTSANKAGVDFGSKHTVEAGTALFTVGSVGPANLLDANSPSVTITFAEAFRGIAEGDVVITYNNGTVQIEQPAGTSVAADFKKLEGANEFLASLDKLNNSLNAVGTAEDAVQTAVTGVLAADGYKLVKVTAAMEKAVDTAAGDVAAAAAAAAKKAVDDAKGEPWSELPFSSTQGQLDVAEEVGKISNVAPGDNANLVENSFILVDKDGDIVAPASIANKLLYNPVTEITNNGSVTGTNISTITSDIEVLGNVTNEANAAGALSEAKATLADFKEAVAEWKELSALQKQLETEADAVEAAAEAVEEAEELFEDLGVQLVKAEDGVADGDVYNENDEDQLADLFVYGDKALTVENFDGEDLFYFGQSPDGSQYNLVVLGKNESITDSVGAENAFDIFAVQNGANTTLYVEQKAFAGNGSSTADLVKVELVGVSADELAFNDGFLTFA